MAAGGYVIRTVACKRRFNMVTTTSRARGSTSHGGAMIERRLARLSTWKVNLLDLGGRCPTIIPHGGLVTGSVLVQAATHCPGARAAPLRRWTSTSGSRRGRDRRPAGVVAGRLRLLVAQLEELRFNPDIAAGHPSALRDQPAGPGIPSRADVNDVVLPDLAGRRPRELNRRGAVQARASFERRGRLPPATGLKMRWRARGWPPHTRACPPRIALPLGASGPSLATSRSGAEGSIQVIIVPSHPSSLPMVAPATPTTSGRAASAATTRSTRPATRAHHGQARSCIRTGSRYMAPPCAERPGDDNGLLLLLFKQGPGVPTSLLADRGDAELGLQEQML